MVTKTPRYLSITRKSRFTYRNSQIADPFILTISSQKRTLSRSFIMDVKSTLCSTALSKVTIVQFLHMDRLDQAKRTLCKVLRSLNKALKLN